MAIKLECTLSHTKLSTIEDNKLLEEEIFSNLNLMEQLLGVKLNPCLSIW